MALTLANIASVLKKVIVPVIQNQLPKENVLFAKIKKNVGTTISNNTVYVTARMGRHSGIYTVAEGKNPRTGKAKYAQPYAAMKYAFGSLEITDQAIEAAKNNDVKALASILQSEITALKDDFRMDLNRQFHGDGSGKLCVANGSGNNSTTLIVDGNPNGGDGTEYLVEGMYIQIGGGDAVQIKSIDSATQVTLETAASWADDAVITKENADEVMGTAGIIDDGDLVATFQGLLRSSNPFLVAHIDDTAEGLSEADMIAQYLKAQRYGFQPGKGACFMGPALFERYGTLLTSMKKTADLKEVLSGGWKGLEFMDGCGVLCDFDTWSGHVEFVDFDALTIAEMSDPFAWLEGDAHGGILVRSATNRTVWEGTLKYYLQLVAKRVKSMAALRNKTTAVHA